MKSVSFFAKRRKTRRGTHEIPRKKEVCLESDLGGVTRNLIFVLSVGAVMREIKMLPQSKFRKRTMLPLLVLLLISSVDASSSPLRVRDGGVYSRCVRLKLFRNQLWEKSHDDE